MSDPKAARGGLSEAQVAELNRLLADVAVRAVAGPEEWQRLTGGLRSLLAPAETATGTPGSRREYQSLRALRARILFDRGFGAALGAARFEDYLAMLPEAVPPRPEEGPFDRLALVDGRVPGRVGRARALAMLGVVCDADEPSLADAELAPEARWIWCRVGPKPPQGPREAGLTAFEGACLFVQEPDAVLDREVFLAGTQHRQRAGEQAVLSRGPSGLVLGCRPAPADPRTAWAARPEAGG